MRSTMSTTIGVVLGLLVVCVAAQRRPPSYSLDDMPDTNFNCRDKILGGYYADPETDCQMFHVCVKVPGFGIQDYRFLCPNETSFDQENQICADWSDTDCEASTLYYSDNFDLYRIGYSPSASPILGGSSATPIPLGPSSVRPPAGAPARPRPRPNNNNNYRAREEEEDYFLQRSETGDRRLQQKDVLRGSSSGNFFRGKDADYDDDADTKYEERKNTASQRVANNNKKKVAVRKLVKRPNEATTFQNYPRTSSTTAATTTRVTQTTRDYYNRDYTATSRDYQRSSSNSDSTTANYYTPTTATPSTGRVNSYQPRYNTIQRNSPQAFTGSPVTTTTTQIPSTNYYNPYQRNTNRYNNTAANTYTTTTAYPSSSNDYNYNTNYNTNTAQKTYTNTDYTKSSNTYYSPTTFAPSTYDAYNANGNDQKQFSSTYNQRNTDYYNTRSTTTTTTTTVAPAQTYNDNNYYQTGTGNNDNYYNNNNYNSNYNYNNNNNYDYQKTNTGDYAAADENVEGESLKTAPSNNYRPSSFNTFQNSYSKPSTAAAARNNTSSAGTSTYNTRQPTTRQPQTQRTYQQQANSNSGSTSATTAKPQVASGNGDKKAGGKAGDTAYDYAYYDDSNTEYEGADPISDHHFGKGDESLKVARSTK